MKEVSMDLFCEGIDGLIDVLYDTQKENLAAAGTACKEAIAKGGVIQVFGSGHSLGFGLEMINRVGSLVPVHVIKTSDFVIEGKVSYEEFTDKNNVFERRPYIADKMYDLYNIGKNDAFIIISNSGINGLVIDMAIKAKKEGHKVICVTSMKHTTAVTSRHPSGKKLYQIADIVIDNCGPHGDALLETDQVEKVCSVSAITGVLIAQSIELETVKQLQEAGVEAPILWDTRLEGAKHHNHELIQKYSDRI